MQISLLGGVLSRDPKGESPTWKYLTISMETYREMGMTEL